MPCFQSTCQSFSASATGSMVTFNPNSLEALRCRVGDIPPGNRVVYGQGNVKNKIK